MPYSEPAAAVGVIPDGFFVAMLGRTQKKITDSKKPEELCYWLGVNELIIFLRQYPTYLKDNNKQFWDEVMQIADICHYRACTDKSTQTVRGQSVTGAQTCLMQSSNSDICFSCLPSWSTKIILAHDPNAKYGPEGYVLAGQKLDYKVEFENEGQGIAFGVYFTDTLDTDLDATTLSIGHVYDLNNVQIAGPGTYNPANRTITWFVGEVGSLQGGYAEYSVNVRDDAPEHTEIINYATVYFPSVPEETRTNGIVSIVSGDLDGDGVPDIQDNCPTVQNPDQFDSDGDGTGNACDGCADDYLKIEPGLCGCGVPETGDGDGDGTPDCNDQCPYDPGKTEPGVCGCGTSDTDTDNDGTSDCIDECPNDASKVSPGACGCGVAETDTDSDGVADCIDNCPNVPNPDQADSNSNGTGDACEGGGDEDGDGVPDSEDQCMHSEMTSPVIIDGCDTSVTNKLVEHGCTMSDLIMACADSASNHKEFVRCVSIATNAWKKLGLITNAEKGKIQNCAGKARLP